jgi:hypothetical protein
VEQQVTQVLDGRHRVDALPEQVARIHLGADVRGVGLFHQTLQGGRVEDQVPRVHFDADLDVGGRRPGLDVAPVRDRARAVDRGGRTVVDDLELRRAGQVERGAAVLTDQIDSQGVGVPEGDPGQ